MWYCPWLKFLIFSIVWLWSWLSLIMPNFDSTNKIKSKHVFNMLKKPHVEDWLESDCQPDTLHDPLWFWVAQAFAFGIKGPRTLQRFSQRFFWKNRCKNLCPDTKLLQLWRKVVVCMEDSYFFCSFSFSVRGP